MQISGGGSHEDGPFTPVSGRLKSSFLLTVPGKLLALDKVGPCLGPGPAKQPMP